MKINNKKRNIRRYKEFTTFYADDVAYLISPTDRLRLERQKVNCLKRKLRIPQRYALLQFVDEGENVTGYQRIAKEKRKIMSVTVYESDNARYPRLRNDTRTNWKGTCNILHKKNIIM